MEDLMDSQSQLEMSLGKLLRWGVMISAAVMLTGGLWFIWKFGGGQPEYGHFVAPPLDSRSPLAALRAAIEGQSRGLLQVGLLLLIATPVARVVLSLALFAKVRDYQYCVFTLIVLAILLLSLAGVL